MIRKIKKIFSSNAKTAVVLKNIVAAFLIKGGGLIISLLSTPAFIAYFGNQAVLGIWYTILSVLTWILNFDLGIGNGLRNRLAVSYAQNDTKTSKEFISSAYISFGVVVFVLAIAGYFATAFVDWNSLFNISVDLVDKEALLGVVRCIFLGIVLQFFLRLVSSVLYAIQKSAVNNAIALLISIFQLVVVLIAPRETPQENLIFLSRMYILIISLPYIVATLVLFMGKLKDIRPDFRSFNKGAIRAVMGVGGTIFVCQILYMIIMNTNDFFITTYTKPENVVDYHIYYKLFSLVGTLAMLALTPLWSMITKALAEKDYVWVQKLYKRVLLLVAIVSLGQIVMLVLLKPILAIWLGENTIEVNYLYAGVFAIWSIVFTLHNVLSTFACGTGKMKTQIICYSAGVIFKLVFLDIIFKTSQNWIYVVLSNIILLLPYCIFQHIALKKEFKLNDKERKENVQK